MPNVSASTCRPGRDRGLQEQHQRAGVGLHRAGDVADEHDAALDQLLVAESAVDRLALGAHRPADACGAGRSARRRVTARAGGSGASAGCGPAARRRGAPRAARAALISAKSLRAQQLVGREGRGRQLARRWGRPGPSRSRRWSGRHAPADSGFMSTSPRSIGRWPRFFDGARSNQARNARSKISRSSRLRDQRAGQRRVDLVAHRQVDRVERRAARPAGGPGRPRRRPRAGCGRT